MATVNDIKRGERYRIKTVNTEMIPMKLLELGFLPENTIELVEVAPLGDPLYVIVNDIHLAIRKELGQYIEVERQNASDEQERN